MKLILFKTVATTFVAAALSYPFINPAMRSGVLASLEALGWVSVILIAGVLLIAVAFYCRSLQRCLSFVEPTRRAAEPRSVWYMFLIPYNFIEDFFIIRNVARSLENEARLNPRLANIKNFGAISGYGWCSAQLVSLLPNLVGEIAAVVTLFLWLAHWRFIWRINNLLTAKETSAERGNPLLERTR